MSEYSQDYSERHLRRLRKKYQNDLRNALIDSQSNENAFAYYESDLNSQALISENCYTEDSLNISSDMNTEMETSTVTEQNSELFEDMYDSSEDEYFYDDEDNDNNFRFDSEDDGDDWEFTETREDKLDKLKHNLKEIIITHSLSREVTEELLRALNEYGIELPKTKKTLMNIKKPEKGSIRIVFPGIYMHIGIQNNLIHLDEKYFKSESVVIDVNIDGLPLYKSSTVSVWPILGFFVNEKNFPGFLIGTYSGSSKPRSSDEFLLDLVKEVQMLRANGVLVSSKKIKKRFDLRVFNCDTPARAFITTTKHHNALNGCHKCDQVGIYDREKHRTVFQTKSGQPRTNASILERHDKDHHNKLYREELNILELNGFVLDQFPLDVMHLVYLGKNLN